MNEPISEMANSSLPTPAEALERELAKIRSERKAAPMSEGRCSAAQAECLMKLREGKLYLGRCPTWDEFCPRHLGLTKAFANRAIRALEEFGPSFFELAQLVRITVEEYRAVAPRVKNKLLHVDGEAIALIPENAARIAATVERLRRSQAKPVKTYTPPIKLLRMTLLARQCTELVSQFRKLSGPKSQDVDRSQLVAVLRQTLGTLGRIELELGLY